MRAALPTIELDTLGRPRDTRWLNHFTRVVEAGLDDEPITRAKIRDRTYEFVICGDSIAFSIDRHPVGRVTKQRWSFDLVSERLTLIGERVVQSSYRLNEAGGYYECPKCREPLELTPGRARCTVCPFEDLHEHTLDSIF